MVFRVVKNFSARFVCGQGVEDSWLCKGNGEEIYDGRIKILDFSGRGRISGIERDFILRGIRNLSYIRKSIHIKKKLKVYSKECIYNKQIVVHALLPPRAYIKKKHIVVHA